MSADQWNEAIRAGLESMDNHGVQQGNQADFLPTSSQSPDNSPQPSPDSQQKDLGAAVSHHPQPQSHPLHTLKASEGQSSQQQLGTLSSQQDQQVSQSSDLTRSQGPVFHGGPRPTISSSQEGNLHKSNPSGPVFSSGGATGSTTLQNVHKVQLPPQQRQQQQHPQGFAHNISSAQHLNPHNSPQPRQVSPQRPTPKINSIISPSKQQSIPMSVQPNTTVGITSSVPQICPTASAMENIHRAPSKQNIRQPIPQQPQRLKVGQQQLSTGTSVGPRNPQPPGQSVRMAAPRFIHPKQQQYHQKFVRPHFVQRPEGHQNRPRLPHHVQNQEPKFSHHSINPSHHLATGAQGKIQRSQNEGMPSGESGHDDSGHSMGHMTDDYMYNEDYDGPLEGVYDPAYEEEEDDEEGYDEDMEEGQYGYGESPYDYDSEEGSDDLSEEESTLFEELSRISPNHPKYEEIVNRLREKGVERDEIDEIINPQRPGYHQVYGNEAYNDQEDEEDDEMADNESAVSSSLQSQPEKNSKLTSSQTGTRAVQSSISQSHGLPQGSHNQNPISFSQTSRAPSLQTSQPAQPHQSQAAPNQKQENLSQPTSQKNLLVHQHLQRPLSHPNPPPSSHIPLRPNIQQPQQQRPKTIANVNQHRKVFQSPVAQTCCSTTHSEASDWSQTGQQSHMAAKPSSSTTAGLPIQQVNSPRQVGPNRFPALSQQVMRPVGPVHQGTTLVRPEIQSTAQRGTNPQVVPLQHIAGGQKPQGQLLQQGGTIQPPMVRGVSPRAHRLRAVVGGPRPSAYPAPSNLRPRTMNPYHMRAKNPQAQFRPPVAASRASQSRLDVMHMQEMLDKQIQAKKGGAPIPNQSKTSTAPSQGVEDQSYLPATSSPSQNTHVFQRPSLPPRRPIATAPSAMRPPNVPPRRAETPQGQQPMLSRCNTPIRPRGPVPIPQTISSSSQQLQPAPQLRMGVPTQDHQGLPGPQTALSKPLSSSINLETLTEAKLNLLSSRSGKLVPNKTYQIKSPIDQSKIYAVWNGEKFVPPGQESAKSQTQASLNSSTSSQSQERLQDQTNSVPNTKASGAPGGSSAFQDKFLQSLQASSARQQEYSEPDTNTNNAEIPPTKSEAPQVPQSTSQTTYVKPLPQETSQESKSDDEEEEEDEDDDSIFKKPFSENEDVFRVCNNCGYTSKNFKRCDGCKKSFQGEVKIHCTKKTSAAAEPPAPQPSSSGVSANKQQMKPSDRFREVMSKASFYGNKDATRGGLGRGLAAARRGLGRTKGGGWKGKGGLQTEEEEQDHYSSDEEAESKRGIKRRSVRPKNPTTAAKKRSKKSDEPVTVTISSDEDEPSSTSHFYPGYSPVPSPARSAGSESPIFPSTHMNPVNAFGRFRRVRMEDEEGQSKLQKKLQGSQNRHSYIEQPPEEELEEDEEEDGDEPAVYEIDIRSVRIGSMRTQPQQPMFISLHGVCFKCRSERTDEEFECEILCSEVEHVKFFAGQPQPVLFLFLSQECGEKIRNICNMEPGDDEYFDPCCTDMKQKMVVIIIESSSEMPLEMLRETLTLWADVNHQEDSDYLEELSEETTNDLLIQSAPPVLTADVERGMAKFRKRYIYDGDESYVPSYPRMPASPNEAMDNEEPDSTSSSPPDIRNHFFGPPIRLLLYPPPPARGISITTEDLMCLAEGEFLNDVVIDFYLQYLYKEKLSEANQKRTHIFSSFFYKRLTQRDRHSDKTEEDAKKSLPERRHARVKKWTKHVDLFSKDFIIVPINEHSHWYLAVICFPGLANPEVVPFIPSATHRADVDETSNDGGESESGATPKNEGSSSQEAQMKHTVLGRQLSGDECNNSDEGKLVGQKQPCILMFDSLAGPSRNPNVKMLREYLQCEWNAKKQEERQIAKIVRGSTPKVPQQSNFSDCGVFLLQYVESFFEDPIADFQIPMKGLQNWFPEELVLHKRQDIHELIMNLHQVYMEERGDPRILDIPFESTPRRQPPPMPMDVPNPNNHEHFLGKPDDGAGPEGALSREDENSNSSAAWELAKPVPSPPFPVALRQNAMFEREDSNQSPFLPKSDVKDKDDKEEEAKVMEEERVEEGEEKERELDLGVFTQDSQSQPESEDSGDVSNTAEKADNNDTEPMSEKGSESEELCTTEGNDGEGESIAKHQEGENQS